jgi:murein DD-endopeptidase MepM/ murein hydrolase activator NlpD
LTVALTVFAVSAGAQPLYRFVSAAGHLVFSDRLPTGVGLADLGDGDAAARRAAVSLHEASRDGGEPILVATNDTQAWAQVAFRIESSRNLDPTIRRSGNFLLPPLSETELTPLVAIDGGSRPVLDISYQYVLGHPGARHDPDGPYRLPFMRDEAYLVSQAYPDVQTHGSDANRHAIDFDMPIGTRVVAARAGLVVETVGDFRNSGFESDHPRDSANFVRILHDDGTFALYGHLAWQSIRVVAGQRVVGGQHIADSGNTGFSSGPHLHFVVQVNRAGALESVPVTFGGAAGSTFTLATGDRPVAY